jgi:hypothetical protein
VLFVKAGEAFTLSQPVYGGYAEFIVTLQLRHATDLTPLALDLGFGTEQPFHGNVWDGRSDVRRRHFERRRVGGDQRGDGRKLDACRPGEHEGLAEKVMGLPLCCYDSTDAVRGTCKSHAH